MGRGGEFWVCHRADCYANNARPRIVLPINRRPAVAAEILMDRRTASTGACKFFRASRDGHRLGRIESSKQKRGPGYPLTIETMAGEHPCWGAGKRHCERTTT